MSQPIAASAVREFLFRHLAEVFSTMLSLPALPVTEPVPESLLERISGTVSFAGEAVTGAVYLHVPVPFAVRITCAMLGMQPEEAPGDADVNDVMGEVANMLAGGLKSWLCDAGAACVLTTPAIIRGASFRILAREGVSQIQFHFLSDAQYGLLEVHIKFNDKPSRDIDHDRVAAATWLSEEKKGNDLRSVV
ncbi:MAG: chemotaxis protein CheX [Verrucomicrobiota bacterium]|jgi:chemotaxis protein CheX